MQTLGYVCVSVLAIIAFAWVAIDATALLGGMPVSTVSLVAGLAVLVVALTLVRRVLYLQNEPNDSAKP